LDRYIRKTYPVGGRGGQAIQKIYTGSTTADATFTLNTFVDTANSMYILKAVNGKDGTNGYYYNAQDQPQLVSLSDSFSQSNVTLDSSLILNTLSQQACETSNDVTDNDKLTGGGYGGPSMLGAGGRSGTYDGYSSYRLPTTPSGYGGGGGGDKAGSDVSYGYPGARARFIMRWVPYS
jgi:hypothetical protein